MRERVRVVSGGLEIDSRPGIGTRVNVEVPLGPRYDSGV
jgi:signal transduction histidine kinase